MKASSEDFQIQKILWFRNNWELLHSQYLVYEIVFAIDAEYYEKIISSPYIYICIYIHTCIYMCAIRIKTFKILELRNNDCLKLTAWIWIPEIIILWIYILCIWITLTIWIPMLTQLGIISAEAPLKAIDVSSYGALYSHPIRICKSNLIKLQMPELRNVLRNITSRM